MTKKAYKKIPIKAMRDSIKARLDAGEALTLAALSHEFDIDVDDLMDKLDEFFGFGDDYRYGNHGAWTIYKNKNIVIPTIQQLKRVRKLYANLAAEAEKILPANDSAVNVYEEYCKPVKEDVINHLNLMARRNARASPALAYEAEVWDNLILILQENADEKDPITNDIINHLQYMGSICKARQSKITDAIENERINGGDVVCLRK